MRIFFGAICCLLALLQTGQLDPGRTAQVSFASLLHQDDSGTVCDHEAMTAAEFAHRLPMGEGERRWITPHVEVGWGTFCRLLQVAESDCPFGDILAPVNSEEITRGVVGNTNYLYIQCSTVCHRHPTLGFKDGNVLGHIWAAAQAKLLNYRRPKDGFPSTSRNFDMAAVEAYLNGQEKLSIPLISENMLNQYCRCGRFENFSTDPPRREEATLLDFSNMDDYFLAQIMIDK